MLKALKEMRNFSHAGTCREAESFPASSPSTRCGVFQQPHAPVDTRTRSHTLNWLFFASVDTVLTKCEASDFALLNSRVAAPSLGPDGKKIQIIVGNVSDDRSRCMALPVQAA